MISQIRNTIAAHQMLAKGDVLTIGVSGGADSVALLHCMLKLCEELGIAVQACHVNHMLRGAESDADEAFVRKLCDDWSVPLTCFHMDVSSLAKKHGLSTEEAARKARYQCFEQMLSDGKSILATAHTLSDSCETVLLNLARGTALRGLCGIPAVRGRIIRPLIEVTREQVEQYCTAQKLSFVTDSSNLSDNYSRNKLRHHVMPILREINPACEQTIGRMTQTLREEDTYLSTLAREKATIDVQKLALMPSVLRKRCLAHLLRSWRITPSHRKIFELQAIICQNHGTINVENDQHITINNGKLSLQETQTLQPQQSWELPLALGEITLPTKQKYLFELLTATEYAEYEKKHKKTLYEAFDYGKIIGMVVLRNRRAGDRIQLKGRGFTSSVKKLFNAHVALSARNSRLIIADDDGVFYLEGFGASDRVALDESTNQILIMQKL